MNIPENYLPRKGDVLVLHGIVRFDVESDEHIHLSIVGSEHTRVLLSFENVFGLIGRTWKVGDQVRTVNDHSDHGEVIAVHGTSVWVKGGHFFETYDSMDLEPYVEAGA